MTLRGPHACEGERKTIAMVDLLCWSSQKECVCTGTTVSHITAALPCCCRQDENDERYLADTAVRHARKETQHACVSALVCPAEIMYELRVCPFLSIEYAPAAHSSSCMTPRCTAGGNVGTSTSMVSRAVRGPHMPRLLLCTTFGTCRAAHGLAKKRVSESVGPAFLRRRHCLSRRGR